MTNTNIFNIIYGKLLKYSLKGDFQIMEVHKQTDFWAGTSSVVTFFMQRK